MSYTSHAIRDLCNIPSAEPGRFLILDANIEPEWVAGGGGAGVTDHGALTGLGDDDHAQYHTDARGDARYWALSTDLATQAELDAIAAAKANAAHTHSADDITSGTLADARIPSGIARDSEVSAAIAAHEAASNPHPVYLTQAEADALYDPLGGELTLQQVYPVGSVYLSVLSTSPATLFGFGTWAQIAGGRMLVGQTGSDTDFDTAEETGGAKTHTLTAAEIPAHTHVVTSQTATTGSATSYEHGTLDTSSAEAEATEVTGSTGGGGAHNNMPPWFVVYIWKRTA